MDGLVAHFDQKHFEEGWLLSHYSYDAFKRKVPKIFEVPDLSQATSRELFEMKQGTDETLEDFMTRVQFFVMKSVPILDLLNRESIAVSEFCKALVDQVPAKLAAV